MEAPIGHSTQLEKAAPFPTWHQHPVWPSLLHWHPHQHMSVTVMALWWPPPHLTRSAVAWTVPRACPHHPPHPHGIPQARHGHPAWQHDHGLKYTSPSPVLTALLPPSGPTLGASRTELRIAESLSAKTRQGLEGRLRPELTQLSVCRCLACGRLPEQACCRPCRVPRGPTPKPHGADH